MTSDLFPVEEQLERIPLPDAEVYYTRHLGLDESEEAILRHLIEAIPWRSENIVLWGKSHPQPRLTAWYGDSEAIYTYSGLRLSPLPWTSILLAIKARIEAAANSRFNSVLINYYRNHRDSMGFHSDDEAELGTQPVIASLSLGEERTLIFRHKTSKVLRPVHLGLVSGSLLLMKGNTQQYWKHGIDKESRPCGQRVNLTFRRILSSGKQA